MNNQKLIIVDFDGPINNLIKSKKSAIKNICRKINVKISPLGQIHLLTYIDQIYENKRIYSYKKIIKLGLRKLKRNKLIKINEKQITKFSSLFEEEISTIKLNHRFLEILKKIKKEKKFTLCVYTSQTRKWVTKALEGYKNLFDHIYCQENFAEPKPSVQNIIKICKESGINPKNAIMIGDNPTIDLMPAKLLGMETVLINQFVDQLFQASQELEDLFSTN